MRLSPCQSPDCPCSNTSLVQSRITKSGPGMQKTALKTTVVLWGDWLRPFRSNLIKNQNLPYFVFVHPRTPAMLYIKPTRVYPIFRELICLKVLYPKPFQVAVLRRTCGPKVHYSIIHLVRRLLCSEDSLFRKALYYINSTLQRFFSPKFILSEGWYLPKSLYSENRPSTTRVLRS